jgi:mannosyltransferase OCH1-like enzyme
MAQKSCVDLHPEYQYKLWTDQDAEQVGLYVCNYVRVCVRV